MTLGKTLLYALAPVLNFAYEHQILTGILLAVVGYVTYQSVAPHILIGWQ